MSDVDLGYDDIDDQPQGDQARQDRNFKALRERAKAEKEAREAAEKELLELREAEAVRAADARRVELKMALQDAGLPGQLASVIPADVAADKASVTTFAQSIGYLAVDAPPTDTPAPSAPASTPGFVPLTAGGQGVPGRVSYEDFTLLLQTDPKKAEAAYEAGRVDGLPPVQTGDRGDQFVFEIPIEHYRPADTERRLKSAGA